MFRKIKVLFIVSLFMAPSALLAQQVVEVDLATARRYAQERNHNLRSAGLDVEAAKYRVHESRATGLPQVSASINYMDNIAIPVQLIPGEFFGFPDENLEVQFGTKYSASMGANISQLIFSGNYLVGLQAAKTYLESTRIEQAKTQIEVNRLVSEAYFLLLATIESLAVIDSTLVITQKLANETGIIVSEGFAEETELDQLLLLVSELEISRDNALVQIEIASALLRFHMGLEDDKQVVPTQSLSGLLGLYEPGHTSQKIFFADENIDMQILRNQQDLAYLQIKREQSNYLPTLSAFLNYQTQAQRDVWDFFGGGKWYSSAVWGVTMSIPIFSSGERHARVKQAQFQFEQTKIAEDQLRANLNIQFQSTLNELQTAWQTLNNTYQNKQLAERIFRRTGVKYREGMARSLDLLNTHNQYLNTQSRYINAGLNLLNQQLALETLLEKGQY